MPGAYAGPEGVLGGWADGTPFSHRIQTPSPWPDSAPLSPGRRSLTDQRSISNRRGTPPTSRARDHRRRQPGEGGGIGAAHTSARRSVDPSVEVPRRGREELPPLPGGPKGRHHCDRCKERSRMLAHSLEAVTEKVIQVTTSWRAPTFQILRREKVSPGTDPVDKR